MDVNLNTSECLVHKRNFTTTEVVNICDDTSVTVENGTFDSMLTIVVVAILVLSTVVVAAFYGMLLFSKD